MRREGVLSSSRNYQNRVHSCRPAVVCILPSQKARASQYVDVCTRFSQQKYEWRQSSLPCLHTPHARRSTIDYSLGSTLVASSLSNAPPNTHTRTQPQHTQTHHIDVERGRLPPHSRSW